MTPRRAGWIARLQATGAWRAAGRPLRRRARIVEAAGDPRRRWRHVFPELAGGSAEQLGRAWISVLGPFGLGGLLIGPFEGGLFVSSLRVRPLVRGFGLGSDLARFAREFGARQGRDVWLVVARGNEPAFAVWRRAGFVVQPPPTPVDRPGHVVFSTRPARRAQG